MAYTETPRTDAGNATFMTTGGGIENFSVENSMLSPVKRKDDIVSVMRNERGASLKTPRARAPLADRRNLPGASKGIEFTPLLQSVTKKNLERKSKSRGGPETPAFLKTSYQSNNSFTLPAGDASAVYGSDLGSSILGDNRSTPLPQVSNSSEQSTPLPVLPKRDAAGVLDDQANVMTLREQENMIDKIEKENFGLKLKIHFLEDALRKTGSEFNEAALKENTDMKVDRITMQRELAQCKKTLIQAERDIEAYRRHLEEVQTKAKRQHADEHLRQELEDLKKVLTIKEEEVQHLHQKVEEAEGENESFPKLKGDIEDLDAELREKDRLLEEWEDRVDRVKAQAKKDSDELDEVYAELEDEKRRVELLENAQNSAAEQTEKLQETQEQLQDALIAQRKAERDLEELQDEMSNKSFATKGLSRQLEEKANKFQTDLVDLREKHSVLQASFDDKSRRVRKLEEELQEHEQDAEVRYQRLQDQHDLLRHEHEATLRKCGTLNDQLRKAVKDLQSKSEEKDLLHSRHDALTNESQTLQRDLSKACAKAQELEESLEDEKRHAQDNDCQLRAESRVEINRLCDENSRLQYELESLKAKIATNEDYWESERRALESQREKAEAKAAGLHQTIEKLQEAEGTLSDKEVKLEKALESEKHRHRNEEAVLERQIQDLNRDMDDKRRELEEFRSNLSRARNDLRLRDHERTALEDKLQALEDEIEVLQGELDGGEDGKPGEGLEVAENEAENLRAQLIQAQQKLDEFQLSKVKEDYDQQDQMARLHHAEELLHSIEMEKQSLQNQLATASLDVHRLQALSAESKAEQDEMRSQLEQMRTKVDETFRSDQEKFDLTTRKLKLESEVSHLREERKSLLDRSALFERKLEAEVAKASSEEAHMKDQIADLQHKLASASGDRERALTMVNRNTQRLESRVKELEDLLASDDHRDSAAAELSMVQKDLLEARKKETEHLQRDSAQKEMLRELKQQVSRFERQAHDAEAARLTLDSPKSSVTNSTRKSEIVEIQRQLTDAHQQLKDARAKHREELKSLHRRLAEGERQAQVNLEAYEQQREQLEADLSTAQHEQDSLKTKNTAAYQTNTRLRTRISSLEQDLRKHRQSATAGDTIAEERADLHDMLKDVKLQAEDLQVQIDARETSLAAATAKEKELRTQLRHAREERNIQTQKASALSAELSNLQNRYERAVNNLSRQQRSWEDERKAMVSRVRFPNMSVSSLQADENIDKLERRHASELKGLAKQIQWLRAKCQRVEGFRAGLVYEKKFMMLQIEMFEACNKVDLQLLQEMGVTPTNDPKASTRLRLGDALRSRAEDKRDKTHSLRAVCLMVMAGCRMRRMASEWRAQKKIREALGKKLEGMAGGKGRKRMSSGRGTEGL